MKGGFSRGEVASSVPFNNKSNGFIGKNVQTAIEEAKFSIQNFSATATNPVSTSNQNFAVILGMTLTPPAGTYMAFFSASIETSLTNAEGEFAIFNNGLQIMHSTREISCSVVILGLITLSANNISIHGNTQAIATVNGLQAIDVRFRTVTGDSIVAVERSLILMRIG